MSESEYDDDVNVADEAYAEGVDFLARALDAFEEAGTSADDVKAEFAALMKGRQW